MTEIEIKVRSLRDSLNPAMGKVADYFLSDMDSFFRDPVSELAAKSGASQAMWVRFCKLLGYSGIKEMRKALYADLSRQVEESDKPSHVFSDTSGYEREEDLVSGMERLASEAIAATAKLQDCPALVEAADLLASSGTVMACGFVASYMIAQDLMSKLVRAGAGAIFHPDYHMMLTQAANMGPADTLVCVSNSGSTPEVLEVARAAGKGGAKVVSVCRFGPTPLSDITLPTASAEIEGRSAAMASRIAALFVVDLLFTTYCNRHMDQVRPRLEASRALFEER